MQAIKAIVGLALVLLIAFGGYKIAAWRYGAKTATLQATVDELSLERDQFKRSIKTQNDAVAEMLNISVARSRNAAAYREQAQKQNTIIKTEIIKIREEKSSTCDDARAAFAAELKQERER